VCDDAHAMKSFLRFLPLALAALAALGSATATVSYHPSTSKTYPAKPENCRLDVLTLAPQRPFVEIGTYDVHGNGDDPVDTTALLLEKVQKHACRQGADAVVGVKNGMGMYVQATTLKWVQTKAQVDDDDDDDDGDEGDDGDPAP
jgi:hypothetical protein